VKWRLLFRVRTAAEPNLDALGQFLRVAKKTPAWDRAPHGAAKQHRVDLRTEEPGWVVADRRREKTSDYRPGDRVGIFTVTSRSANEVLLGDKDKHLDVVVSVHKQADGEGGAVVVTVVHVKNWLGRLYMLDVAPAHRVFARSMVRAVGRGA
jgi:hypothetical protein